MAGAFDQVAAAIPVRALLLVRHQDARFEEQPVPAAHQHAVVQRPTQVRRRGGILHRRQRRQIGPDRQNVGAGEFGEIRIGEGRVVARAVGRDAEAQRAVEVVVATAAEAGIAVRGQVGRGEAAERRIDPLFPGEGFGRIRRVAAGAVGGLDQRLAARDLLGGDVGFGIGANAVRNSNPTRDLRRIARIV